MNQEIEQSYGVNPDKLPSLETYPWADIEQVYFSPWPPDPHYPEVASGEWRVRKLSDQDGQQTFVSTVKFGDKASGSRTEIETELQAGDFGSRTQDIENYGYAMVSKRRFTLPNNTVIDRFDPALHGELWLAEREFDSPEAMAKAELPDWASPLEKSPSNRQLAADLAGPAAKPTTLSTEELTGKILERYQHFRHLVVTVSGMSGSGKSHLARALAEKLEGLHIATDNFHVGSSNLLESYGEVNHDWPHAYDYTSAGDTARRLTLGETLEIPQYDFARGERKAEAVIIPAAKLVLVDGLYAWRATENMPPDTARYNVLVNTPLYVCLLRRLMRDAGVKGSKSLDEQRTVQFSAEENLHYMLAKAIPTYLEHTKPAAYFDAVI